MVANLITGELTDCGSLLTHEVRNAAEGKM